MPDPRPLAHLTTMGVGGVPELMRVAGSREELVQQAKLLWREADEWLILGGGSNLVVADSIPNLQVLRVESKGVTPRDLGNGKVSLVVEAGENWDDLVGGTVQAGLAGLEALSGIPGSVGAAPIQNIGAYGAEVASTIRRVGFAEFPTGAERVLENSELGFAYRDSVFKRGLLGVVTWVEFELENLGGLSQPIRFEQLAKALGVEIGAQVPVAQVREAVIALRRSKGMVFDAADPDSQGCGSFFTNPIVSDSKARTLPADAPRWEVDEDGLEVKLSAAWLIEHAGIRKGFSLAGSGAAVSSKHSLAITNRGSATAQDVLQLAEFIQLRVANQFGINLLPEPTIVGF